MITMATVHGFCYLLGNGEMRVCVNWKTSRQEWKSGILSLMSSFHKLQSRGCLRRQPTLRMAENQIMGIKQATNKRVSGGV